VWSIPSWKYRINTGAVHDARPMRRELAIVGWFGVICFVCGVTLVFIANS